MSLTIGKYMRYALERDSELTDAVGGRIYPVIVPEDGENTFPYITFASNGFSERVSKDGVCGDVVTEEVLICARTLDELEDVAQLVRTAMADAWPAWNGTDDVAFTIAEQTMTAGPEDLDLVHDAFYMTLLYQIETEEE